MNLKSKKKRNLLINQLMTFFMAITLVFLVLMSFEAMYTQAETLPESGNFKEIRIMEYKNHNVRLTEVNEEKAQVFVDDVAIEVLHDPTTDRYSTIKLPYMDFNNLEELAKKVIDNHPDFRR